MYCSIARLVLSLSAFTLGVILPNLLSTMSFKVIGALQLNDFDTDSGSQNIQSVISATEYGYGLSLITASIW